MITILVIFGVIELALILFSLVSLAWWKEMESLLSCVVFVYGTGIVALGLLIATVVHDYVDISTR